MLHLWGAKSGRKIATKTHCLILPTWDERLHSQKEKAVARGVDEASTWESRGWNPESTQDSESRQSREVQSQPGIDSVSQIYLCWGSEKYSNTFLGKCCSPLYRKKTPTEIKSVCFAGFRLNYFFAFTALPPTLLSTFCRRLKFSLVFCKKNLLRTK